MSKRQCNKLSTHAAASAGLHRLGGIDSDVVCHWLCLCYEAATVDPAA